MKALLLFFVLTFATLHCTTLSANWEEHLRKCEGKEGNHSIPEIDFIYLINLKDRPKKWQTCIKQLAPYGITPYRFDAINGWKLDKEVFQHLGCPNLHPAITPGMIAVLLGHLSILHDAYVSGYNTIWVMEDDIEVLQDPRQIPSAIQALDKLVPDWDLFYTDMETKDFYGKRVPSLAIASRPNLTPAPLTFYLRRIPINKSFMEIGMRYGMYSVIIRRSGMKKILEYFTKYRLHLPIDQELVFVPKLKQIVMLQDIVSTLPGILSDTSYPLSVNDQKDNSTNVTQGK